MPSLLSNSYLMAKAGRHPQKAVGAQLGGAGRWMREKESRTSTETKREEIERQREKLVETERQKDRPCREDLPETRSRSVVRSLLLSLAASQPDALPFRRLLILPCRHRSRCRHHRAFLDQEEHRCGLGVIQEYTVYPSMEEFNGAIVSMLYTDGRTSRRKQ